MSNVTKLPKGRLTIRRNGSLTGDHGPRSTAIRLWNFDAKPESTLAKLEAAYLAGLAAVDRVEERKKVTAASGKYTPAGVNDDVTRHVHHSRRGVERPGGAR